MDYRTIKSIFEQPPSGQAELEQRLSEIDVNVARESLVNLLMEGSLRAKHFSLFSAIVGQIGLGNLRYRLIDAVGNERTDLLIRKFAITALAQDDPDALSKEIAHLDHRIVKSLTDLPFVDLMIEVQMNSKKASEVTDLIIDSPVEMWDFLLSSLENARRDVGTPASVAYAHALGVEQFVPLQKFMLEALIREGSKEALTLLTKLRDQCTDQECRKRFQGAILRIHTNAINVKKPAIKAPEGTAYVSNCDGQGAYLVLAKFKVSKKNQTTADICIRAATGIRDGFIIPGHADADFDDMLRKIEKETGAGFASIPLEQAAFLVNDAKRLASGLDGDFPEQIDAPLRLFEQVEQSQPHALKAEKLSHAACLKQLKQLFCQNMYSTWFLDPGDLAESGISVPSRKSIGDGWFRKSADKLVDTPIQTRLLAMIKHMAKWHNWNGETEFSHLCAAAAKEAELDFGKSALVRVLLENSVAASQYQNTWQESLLSDLPFGDPQHRRALRGQFFGELKHPRGKHMALLDFADAALCCLHQITESFSGEHRPREDEKLRIAYELARLFNGEVWGTPVSKARKNRLEKSLAQACNLDGRGASGIIGDVLTCLAVFVKEVCGNCPVDCISRPNARMNSEFFAAQHPVIGLGEDDTPLS